jgi:uncharacterized protein involved in exopolysaccharide biosynthesis
LSNIQKTPLEPQPRSLKENLDLIRSNIFPVIVITLASLLFSGVYAWKALDIYKATALIKISKPQGNILEAQLTQALPDMQTDRFLLNEIEVIKSYRVRQKVASALVDSFNTIKSPGNFYLILDRKTINQKDEIPRLDTLPSIIAKLGKIDIEQKRGLDFVEITVESPKPYEAALVANVYSNAYKSVNLDITRNQLSAVREFLVQQRLEMQKQLSQSEDLLKSFQEKGSLKWNPNGICRKSIWYLRKKHYRIIATN